VADIGGTNARFAIVESPGAAPDRIEILSAADYSTLGQAIAAYLDMTGIRPRTACLAVAGPVVDGHVRFSNRGWRLSAAETANHFDLNRVLLVNDFEALALGLPRLQASQLLDIGGGAGEPGRPLALIGPGTGLGVAGLVPVGTSWAAIPGEGGHVDLAPVEDLEIEILRTIRRERGRASAESVLSGPGLERLAKTMAAVLGQRTEIGTTEEITRRGASEPGLHRQVLDIFCALLGGAAGNLALTLGARGGVFLGGGILPRISEVLMNSDFRCRFEAKGRMTAHMRLIPTRLILASNPALTGAAVRLESEPA
jgi:glucokinase